MTEDRLLLTRWNSLAEMLEERAACHPQRTAVTYLYENDQTVSLTYEQLFRRSAAVANQLHQIAPVGSRAALLFPPGLEFVLGSLLVRKRVLSPRRLASRSQVVRCHD